GECARDFGNVLLCVGAVDTERVQFEQLASVVFVQSSRCVLALLLALLRTRWWRETAQSGTARKTIRTERSLPGHRMWAVSIRALAVVEVEEHRRAVGRRPEQIAEMPEHVRSDGITLVLREHELFGSFSRVDVEVIEPEVRQHLLQLSFAVGRAHDFLHGEFDQRFVRTLLSRRRPLGVLDRRRLIRIGRFGGLLLRISARLHLRNLVSLGDISRAQIQRFKILHTGSRGVVWNPFGMKLLLDVLSDANLAYSFDIAGSRTESHP